MTSNLDKPIAIATGIMLAIIALCSVIMFNTSAARAEVGCYVGGSIGYGISANKITDGPTSVTLGTEAPMASPEVGCKATINKMFTAGALARFDWMNASTKLTFSEATAAIKQHGRWMAAATLGFMLNPSVELYGLAGISGSQFKFGGDGEKFNSFVIGAGLNLDIGQGPLSLFVEGNAFLGRPETFEAAKVSPRDYAIRTGLKFRLN